MYCILHEYSGEISVIDAESVEAISGARAQLSYEGMDINKPEMVVVYTESDGTRLMSVATLDRFWVVSKSGYIRFRGKRETSPPQSETFRLYREPRPVIRIVVPNKFRGMLEIKRVSTDKDDSTAGKRLFIFRPDASGNVLIRDTPLLQPVYAELFEFENEDHGIYAAATRFNLDGRDGPVLSWWVRSDLEQGRLSYFIGTVSEAEALVPHLVKAMRDDEDSRMRGG